MRPDKDKFRHTLNRLIDSGRFIPGIYNYCDRWCERCPLSHKCMTYAHEREMWGEGEGEGNSHFDIDKFWEQINLSFEVALDLITEEANRCNIDLAEAIDVTGPSMEVNPVEEMAGSYGTLMGKWIEENEEALTARSERLTNCGRNNMNLSQFANAVEVVRWYCYYIEGKVFRAFYDLIPRMFETVSDPDALNDNKGSAKAAIIAITRSIEALVIMYEEMKDQEDEILDFLSLLSELKKQLLAAFPTAMEFRRPGFDDL